MHVVAVSVHVTPGKEGPFKEAILDNARHTREEPGNIRFDVLQEQDDPTRFLLYEVYHTKDDFTTHQKTEHYLRFRDTVADWMAKPRQGVKYDTLFFGDE